MESIWKKANLFLVGKQTQNVVMHVVHFLKCIYSSFWPSSFDQQVQPNHSVTLPVSAISSSTMYFVPALLLPALALASPLASRNVYAGPPADQISILSAQSSGNGCPQGSVSNTLSPDRTVSRSLYLPINARLIRHRL